MKIKTVKRICLVSLFCMLFVFSAEAKGTEFYYQQYDYSGIHSLEQSLSDEAKELLKDIGISATDPDFTKNITAKNIFSSIFSFFKSGLSGFKTAFVSLLFICIAAAVTNLFCHEKIGEQTVTYVSVLCMCTVVLVPLFSHISTVVSAIKAGSVFMLSFVPVYGSVLLLGSMNLTAAASSGTLILAAQAVSMLSSFVILPLLSGYLAIGISSTVFGSSGITKLNQSIKKAMLWILSGVLTLFVGVLSVQTAISSAADSLSTKTAKFMINSFVPVVGPSLSESLSTVLGSFKLLRSSAAVYAILAVAAVFLPVILQTFFWQLTLKGAQAVAHLFSQEKSAAVLNPLSDALSLTNGIILFVFALFVISLSVLLGMGGTA